MSVLAATATGQPAAAALLFLALIAVTPRLRPGVLLCPFVALPPLQGHRQTPRPFGGRSFGICRRCDGTGRQLRPGRRAINYLRRPRQRPQQPRGGTR